ncbi:MAG TPA: protease pro-enzyme activation domain-containing protein [Terracidiphilus sp.]|nr:protease pro-enzyme activation domain-containing protein [Terracidiphilus sp.]
MSLRLVLACLLLPAAVSAQSSVGQAHPVAPSRLLQPIDEHVLVTLKGNVRRDVAQAPDLGPVEDALPLHMFLLLQRTPAQQADLENLIARQQQPGAPEYHKWLTPAQFGARFGAAPQDIGTLTAWLQSHGFEVRSVLNNASMIDFAGTSGLVREAFHTQLHYVGIRGGKYPALVQNPQIPAALASVIAGIEGLNKIPARTTHTEPRQASFDRTSHHMQIVNPTAEDFASPAWDAGAPYYFVTPQDLYTIYDVNPVFTGGNVAASATVAVIEESDIEYGTVNSSTGVAAGGDVATFRSLFGVPGTLNMHVYHGYGSVACNDPGIDPDGIGEDVEASLDAEWINATAPSANEIFMSCDQSPDNGIWSSMTALIDNNLADVMSLSYSSSEEYYTSSSDYDFQDGLFAQAATQGQSILISTADSGSDVADQDTTGTATSGINVSAFGSPLVTMAGGTDFQDMYDAAEDGPAQSTYWSSTNSAYYGDALSYVPETVWNASCASSIYAVYEGYTGAGYCATGNVTNGNVVGGSGGISTHYAAPSWQTGTSGYSNSMRSQPDISGFASSGFWGHALLYCDSNPADGESSDCVHYFGVAGGTSFVAPYMAGVFGLLRTATGERQGVLNPALYALAKAQYTGSATKTACYANGQTSNTGVTTGLPAAACIFNDVTTSNNDVPCATGSTDCYVNSGANYGMLSLTGSSALTVAYPSTIGFDQAIGLGSVNVHNLISKWNTAFTSTTAISANPASITSSESTTLKATVTGGAPAGYVDTPPALTGTVTFKAGTKVVGSCTLSSGTCSTSVAASSLQSGNNSMTAVFAGSGTYPSSTSTAVTVTVSASQAVLTSPTPSTVLAGPSVTFTWSTATGATDYGFRLGTTVGGNNLWGTGPITGTSTTPTNLPTNGEIVYARLTTFFGSVQVYTDYTFTAATQSALTSPTPSTVLAGPKVTFSWSTAAGATDYGFRLGTTEGSNNIFGSGPITATSVTLNNLPTNGETIHARLTTFYGSIQVYTDYTFTAATQSALTSPTPSSVLSGAKVTFSWTTVAGATDYGFRLGTTVGGNNLWGTGPITGTSTTPTNLPTNGETIYARLTTFYGAIQVYTDYTFTAAP